MHANWGTTSVGDLDVNQFTSCRHANAAISWVSHAIIPPHQLPQEDSPTYEEDVAQILHAFMTRSSPKLKLGSWILQDVKFRSRAGDLVFFLSEFAGIYVFAKSRSTTGRNYFSCLLCPRSRSCTHLATVPMVDEEVWACEDPAVSAEPRTELIDTLVSRARYPFDLELDESLRNIVRQRTFSSVSEWFYERFPDGLIYAEQRTCCDMACEFHNANHSRRPIEVRFANKIYSLHGYGTLEGIREARCVVCLKRYPFDGRSIGVLNYSNRYLFTVELILDLLEFKAISGTPTYSYWHARCNTMLKPWSRQETIQMKRKWMNIAGRLNGVMTAFLSLVVYPTSQFQCCKDPAVVCIDGIVLSVESRRINLKTPWLDPRPLRTRFNLKEDRSIVTLTKEQKEHVKGFIRDGTFLEDFAEFCGELPSPLSQFMLRNVVAHAQDRLYLLIQADGIMPQYAQTVLPFLF